MKFNRLKRIMAYVYMPLFFLLLGYGIVYVAFTPYINLATTVAKLVTYSSDTSVVSVKGLTSIFDPTAVDEEAARGDEVDVSVIQMPLPGEHFAQMSCESIDLSVPLYFGDSDEVLDNGAGMYQRCLPPGYNRTMLVGGHNHTIFKPLENIEIGDVITIQTSYGIYEYRVRSIEVLPANDPDAFDLYQRDEELLVAYTCYPFTAISTITDDRLFVTAEKISGPEVVGVYE